MTVIPPKLRGWRRILRATAFSWHGLRAAFQSEEAFRMEVYAAVILIPLAFWVHVARIERVALVGSVLLLLICELVNSAIEAIVNRIGPEWHELSRKAKDIGSAIVFLVLVLCGVTWGLILCP